MRFLASIVRWVTRNPGSACLLAIVVSCLVWGPAATGAWLGSTGRWLFLAVWSFVHALFSSAF